MHLPRPSFRAFIALGSNLGNTSANLLSALHGINALPFTKIEAVSPTYISEPVNAPGSDYLNAVVALQTQLAPLELLHALQTLEKQHGRQRSYLNAPRTLDLDIIWIQGTTYNSEQLQVPHPRWQERAFVVEPMSDILSTIKDKFVPTMPSMQERKCLITQQTIQRSKIIWENRS